MRSHNTIQDVEVVIIKSLLDVKPQVWIISFGKVQIRILEF